jgi:hypothetical protein
VAYPPSMTLRWVSRFDRAPLVAVAVGAAIALLGAALPFVSALGEEAWSGTSTEVLEAVQRSPGLWGLANGLFLVGTVPVFTGVAVAAPRDRFFAPIGLSAFALACLAWAAALVVRIAITPSTAEAYVATGVVDRVGLDFGMLGDTLVGVFHVAGFIGILLLALGASAAQRSDVASLMVPAGLVGTALAVTGVAVPAYVYLAAVMFVVRCADRGRE